MVELKTEREIAQQREAGRVVAEALAAVRGKAEVGVTLAELDEVAATVIKKAGAAPAFLNYNPHGRPRLIPVSSAPASRMGSPNGDRGKGRSQRTHHRDY